MATGARVLDSLDEVLAITHPTRRRVLDELRTPGSAASVARRLGEPRQRVNHHVRELARAGLIRSAGERRRGNLVEHLYEAVAGTFTISSRVAFGERDGERDRALAAQVALRHLVDHGERLQFAAVTLLDRAAFDGEDVPSATVEATVRLAGADDRAAFVDEYLAAVRDLIERYAGPDGDEFTVGLAVHPRVEEAP